MLSLDEKVEYNKYVNKQINKHAKERKNFGYRKGEWSGWPLYIVAKNKKLPDERVNEYRDIYLNIKCPICNKTNLRLEENDPGDKDWVAECQNCGVVLCTKDIETKFEIGIKIHVHW